MPCIQKLLYFWERATGALKRQTIRSPDFTNRHLCPRYSILRSIRSVLKSEDTKKKLAKLKKKISVIIKTRRKSSRRLGFPGRPLVDINVLRLSLHFLGCSIPGCAWGTDLSPLLLFGGSSSLITDVNGPREDFNQYYESAFSLVPFFRFISNI